MIINYTTKCLSCEKKFVLRITVGSSRNPKFRMNCPYCDLEMHGEVILNYRKNNGALDYNHFLPEIRITNAEIIHEPIGNDIKKYVTIFTDLPIIRNKYISDDGTPLNLWRPTFQAMYELKDNAPYVIKGLNDFYALPENDFYLIKNAYNQYKENNFEKAKEILEKITPEVPSDISRVPSTCSLCYQIFFVGLLGEWHIFPKHVKLIEDAIKEHIENIFEVPQNIQKLDVIESLINEYFDLVNQIFDCKEIICIARYFDFIDLEKQDKHFISIDYPDKFFNLYEQLCEYAHNIIKIEIGYLNIKNRGDINLFKDNKFSNYEKYFNKAKLFQSLDLINEDNILGNNYNFAIDRNIRNGIAHKKISFSSTGQEIIVRKENKLIKIEYDLALKKTIELCRICIYCFSFITNQKRMISDEPWNHKK